MTIFLRMSPQVACSHMPMWYNDPGEPPQPAAQRAQLKGRTMARFNQFAGRTPEYRQRRADQQQARRGALESRGADIGGIMAREGVGARRACAIAERAFIAAATT